MDSETHEIELDELISLFFDQKNSLGAFEFVEAIEVPEPQRSLLDHEFHMTVTLEKFHSSPVEVVVLNERQEEHFYCREILLETQSDQRIVQYGIVRLNFQHLESHVQAEILKHEKPLGRILIENDVLRQVRLLSLYQIKASDVLKNRLVRDEEFQFGRTAIIYCNDEPAIELLEVVGS